MAEYRDESRELLRQRFAPWLAGKMELQFMTQEQLAATVGVTQQQVSNWLSGKAIPKTTVFSRVALALGVRPEKFWKEIRAGN